MLRFYYADQRQTDGGPSIPVDGEAAGEVYVELAEKKEQGPWNYTFIKGKGHVDNQLLQLPKEWS
jgi:hypothetical protein